MPQVKPPSPYPVDAVRHIWFSEECFADGSPSASSECEEATEMLYYALVFFVIALIAAFLGFGGLAVAFAGIAKILFFLFVILFVVSLVMHVGRRA
jgi:uncharacterized membrane protein YtjA (UPF0391 family)